MSISKSTPTATVQEDNRAAKETCTVYTVACDDSNGTRAEVFCFETEALRWLAENAEGPDDDTRAELLQLADARDDSAFCLFLERSRDDFATYQVESDDLPTQPFLML
jgi:hypothetical protein